jgi:hypothetical protein
MLLQENSKKKVCICRRTAKKSMLLQENSKKKVCICRRTAKKKYAFATSYVIGMLCLKFLFSVSAKQYVNAHARTRARTCTHTHTYTLTLTFIIICVKCIAVLSNDVCTYATEYLKSDDEHRLSDINGNCTICEHNWIYCMCTHTSNYLLRITGLNTDIQG